MELPIDPLLEAHLLDALDVARPRAIPEAVERVQNGLVFGEFGDGQLAFEIRVQRGWSGRFVAAGGSTRRRRFGVPGEGSPAEEEAHSREQ